MLVSRNLMFGILLACIIACGGSGESTPRLITVKVAVDWPEVTRGIDAPPYANWVRFNLTLGSVVHPWYGERPIGSSATTTTYETQSFYHGNGTLKIEYLSGSHALGAALAKTELEVFVTPSGTILKSDGSPLENLSFNLLVTSLSIDVLPLKVGSTVPVWVGGRNGQNPVGVPLDWVSLRIVGGTANASLIGDQLTALRPGYVTIEARFLDVVSKQQFQIK